MVANVLVSDHINSTDVTHFKLIQIETKVGGEWSELCLQHHRPPELCINLPTDSCRLMQSRSEILHLTLTQEHTSPSSNMSAGEASHITLSNIKVVGVTWSKLH
ncbi:hypothetical protein EB796_024873 [Bugula neritina]|uniref:Uncharacterized protein n=1 Tax=Bugula neritina TaxID=10212 RepID=A0A7J7IS98_BUGNE|nr:hypothetical protein EB796_024873 [Bugula neritina]